jgi:hypothetical protein
MKKFNVSIEFLPLLTGQIYKADEIRQSIQLVIRKIEHYKTEHNRIFKEATTLLEIALWKANIYESTRTWQSTSDMEKDVSLADMKRIKTQR